MDATERPVVSNTTPLINLAGVGLLNLLPNIYGTITISTVVRKEYEAGRRPSEPLLNQLPWLRIIDFVPFDVVLPHNLDRGEATTIRLALAVHASAVLLDEQLARRVAVAHNLPIVGTLGVLLVARQTALIPALRPVIDQMIAQGRRISPTLRATIVRAAGEEP
ncbi:MAG: DUF3368 domain-containing protein [Roseiflexaceae bacterium]